MGPAELFPATCGLLYLCAAAFYARERQWGFAITYVFYSAANVGLIIAALEARRP